MTHPAHNLPPAPGWAIHPSLMTTCAEIPGYRVVKIVSVEWAITQGGRRRRPIDART